MSTCSLNSHMGTSALTTWYHDPDEVHKDIVHPEIIRFWTTVRQAFVIVIKHARGIVKNISINLARRD